MKPNGKMATAAYMEQYGNPTADWQFLKDRNYCKKAVYGLQWDVDLGRSLICAAPNGGPMAVTRDQSQILLLAHRDTTVPRMTFYSAAGQELASLPWDKGRALGMGWTPDERFVAVFENGVVVLVNVQGELVHSVSLPKEVVDQGLLDCRVWDYGLVVLTKKLLLYAFTALDTATPKMDALPTPKLDKPPTAWCVLKAPAEAPRKIAVLLSVQSGTVYRVTMEGEHDMLVHTGPFVSMVVAPSGNMLACFNDRGYIFVVAHDFSRTPLELNTERKAPEAMAWCGTNTVLLYWKETGVFMLGPSESVITYKYSEPVHMITEIDGARIVSNSRVEFVQKVSRESQNIFTVGSLDPAALLYDAADMFRKKNPRADETMRGIRDALPRAVDDCIAAAAYEFHPKMQKALLAAASFGKNFLPAYKPDGFLAMTRALRVLNALHEPDVGIPMTYWQYERCTPEGLISRLLERHLHLLAHRLSEYLGLSTHRVVVHWACMKVRSRTSDEPAIYDAIIGKINNIAGISTAEIASAAFTVRKFELATRLLMHEPRASEQVPLLLSMGQLDLALAKAVESCDSDLAFLAIFHLRRVVSEDEFIEKLSAKPEALALFVQYCRQVDVPFLKKLYATTHRTEEAVSLTLVESMLNSNPDVRVKAVQVALNVYEDLKMPFHADASKNQIKLLLAQKQLESLHKVPFVGLSLSDTIFNCVKYKDHRSANSLRSDFKVPDQRFWWLKLRALVTAKDWVGLEEFSHAKSPIGLRPFADLLIDASMFSMAAGYVQRLSDPAEKCQLFMRMNNWKEAADTALHARSRDLLEQVRSRVQTPEGIQYIDSILNSGKL